MLISFSGRTKQIFFLIIKLEPWLLSWLQPRKNNFAPTELDVSISAYDSISIIMSCHYTVHLFVGKKICAVHSVVNNDLLIVSWRPPTGFEIGGSLLCAAAIPRAASAKLGPRIFWSRTSVLYLKIRQLLECHVTIV